jgi:uncharacterized protein YecT (DUF1311 family)
LIDNRKLSSVLAMLILTISALVGGCKEDKPKVTITLPQAEATFVGIVSMAQAEAKGAQNDMQLGGTKAKRDRALCDSGLSYVVNDWVGKIERIDSNSDGKGVLSVSIASDILVKTWNNDLSDLVDRTLIEPGTPLFEAASAMSPGQHVRFSGLLFRGSDGDCVKESSLTLKGKVTEPEFIFRFDKIARYTPGTSTHPAAAVSPATPAAAPAVTKAAEPVAPSPVAAPAVVTVLPPSSTPSEQQADATTAPSVASVAPLPASAGTEPFSGPSFDCAKAGSVIEQLICKDDALARLDVQLAQAYKAAARQASDKGRLKSEQLDWLKNRRNDCSTAECVSAAYEARLAALRD